MASRGLPARHPAIRSARVMQRSRIEVDNGMEMTDLHAVIQSRVGDHLSSSTSEPIAGGAARTGGQRQAGEHHAEHLRRPPRRWSGAAPPHW
eukprot:4536595-Prymnesium_polylepis.2